MYQQQPLNLTEKTQRIYQLNIENKIQNTWTKLITKLPLATKSLLAAHAGY